MSTATMASRFSGLFVNGRARELVDLARETILEIEKIRPGQNDCRILATSLLFKERKP